VRALVLTLRQCYTFNFNFSPHTSSGLPATVAALSGIASTHYK